MRRAYIETFGCQMNERDSEIMAQKLAEASCLPTDDLDSADVVVVNTCAIRAKAEQKAYSLLGRLKKLKAKKPGMIIAVAGCVAQQDGKNMLRRTPYVDLVVGPQNIYSLVDLIDSADKLKGPFVRTEQSATFEIPPFLPTVATGASLKRFVTIMQGCNNFCTYCVVPFTRGREVSRRPDDILAEVEHLVARGVKEITLLGQNVNSYGRDQKDGSAGTFSELLFRVAAVEGLARLRFTTSNPKDLSGELMQCFAEIDTLCPHFHLPVQSGSDRILQKMNRRYSVAGYLDKVRKLRTVRPDIALTTDIIVGFPGETDEDFEATMELIETVRYHSAFSFKYSDRPHAKSAAFADKVDEEVKVQRLARLQARQNEISLDCNREYVGQELEVMVEGESKLSDGQWSGRTGTNQIVNFTGCRGLRPGDFRTVHIDEACLNSLRGSLRAKDQSERIFP